MPLQHPHLLQSGHRGEIADQLHAHLDRLPLEMFAGKKKNGK
jgi:hypothetical protein